MRKFLISVLLSLAAIQAYAQFYVGGEDPPAKWSSLKTQRYRLVYPSRMDSLARVYASELEKWRPIVGLSAGSDPCQRHCSRLPVILHGFTAASNGSVAWAPKRMELYTLPESGYPDAIPWEESLTVHESRHVAQMQFGYRGWFKPLSWLFGDISTGALSGIYPGTMLLEGDAVVAETALTRQGRGRRADFLNYYMLSFDAGQRRDWYRWRFGSYKLYAPDHYALGYMTVAGMRVLYDSPKFIGGYFGGIARRPLRLYPLSSEIRKASGTNFKEAFSAIQDMFYEDWKSQADARAPYTPARKVSVPDGWYSVYSGTTAWDGRLFSVLRGKRTAGTLVSNLPGGDLTEERPFSTSVSKLDSDGDRLWWSEAVPDKRWSMAGESRIRYAEHSPGKLTIKDFVTGGRFFNPAADSGRVAYVEYPVKGGSVLWVRDTATGETLQCAKAPDGMQLSEPAWWSGRLFVSAVTAGGTGIYEYSQGEFSAIMAPAHATLGCLRAWEEGLSFSSDRTGNFEIYSISPRDGKVFQLTSTRYGARDAFISSGTLYHTRPSLYDGWELWETDRSDFLGREVVYQELTPHAIADALSDQEKALQASSGRREGTAEISESTRYCKPAHLFRIHSWAPLAISSDDIMNLDGDIYEQDAFPGATVYFQNDLGTLSGSAAYCYGHDSRTLDRRHILSANFSYSGLYPVLDVSFKLGSRDAVRYSATTLTGGGFNIDRLGYVPLDYPLFRADIGAGVPLKASSGGWLRGLTPRASLSFRNDVFDKGAAVIDYSGTLSGTSVGTFTGISKDIATFMTVADLSVSGYLMQAVPQACAYPRLGIGAEAGYHTRPLLSDIYTSAVYGYLYGYLPGVRKQQGLRLTGLYQHLFGLDGLYVESYASDIPRGWSGTDLQNYLNLVSSDRLRLTADYSIPLWLGDLSFSRFLWWDISKLNGAVYLTHFSLDPHADLLMFDDVGKTTVAYSAGVTLKLHAASFLSMPFGGALGFRVGYNGGRAWQRLKDSGMNPGESHIYAGLTLTTDL